MTVTKLDDGQWYVSCYPNGRKGKHVRRKFTTRGEAVSFERHILNESVNKPWLSEKKDNRTLSELIEIWYNAHGITLTRGNEIKIKMLKLAENLGDIKGVNLTSNIFATYRRKRLTGEIDNGAGPVSPTTLNIELTLLLAVFNELIRLEEWQQENPLNKIRKFKVKDSEMAFLSHVEISRLLNACKKIKNKDLYKTVELCLRTGARWGEAEKVLKNQFSPYRVTFIKTKSGENRTVPLDKDFYKSLNIDEKSSDRLFVNSHHVFAKALTIARINLPENQKTHVLRHTFASHFMMNGGNILVLKEILGHSDIKMTMKYAHFAPSYLEETLTLNPLGSFQLNNTK